MSVEDPTAKKFLQEKKLNLSENTIETYRQTLERFEKLLDCSFEAAGKEEIMNAVSKLKESDLKESTANLHLQKLKAFYKWLNEGDEYPECVDWIDINHNANNGGPLPDELLTEKDVEKMVNACDRVHDKAMVITLYESGCRLSEFLSLNVGSVSFGQKMGKIILPKEGENQKTGQRRIPIINSIPYLQEWLNNHPGDSNDDPLWISFDPRNKRKRISRPGFQKKIKVIAERAGIEKNVYTHLFRHSRATHLAQDMTESQLRKIFGWSKSSDTPSKYMHLAGRDVDRKFKELHGIEEEEEEEKEETLKPRECPRCDYQNPAGARFCNKCGLALDLEAAEQVEEEDKRTSGVLSEMVTEEEKEAIIKAAQKLVSEEE